MIHLVFNCNQQTIDALHALVTNRDSIVLLSATTQDFSVLPTTHVYQLDTVNDSATSAQPITTTALISLINEHPTCSW